MQNKIPFICIFINKLFNLFIEIECLVDISSKLYEILIIHLITSINKKAAKLFKKTYI